QLIDAAEGTGEVAEVVTLMAHAQAARPLLNPLANRGDGTSRQHLAAIRLPILVRAAAQVARVLQELTPQIVGDAVPIEEACPRVVLQQVDEPEPIPGGSQLERGGPPRDLDVLDAAPAVGG